MADITKSTPIGTPYMSNNQWYQVYKSPSGQMINQAISAPGANGQPYNPGGVAATTATNAPKAAPKTTTAAKSSTSLDVMKLAESAVKNPNVILTPDMKLENQITPVSGTAPGTNVDPNDPKYQTDPAALNQTAATVGQTATATTPTQGTTATVNPALTQDAVAAQDMTAAQGQPSQNALISDQQVQNASIDINSIASGVNPDGSLNATGQALNDFASLNLNDVDARATTKGQLSILQADFTGPDGQPTIPIYAQGAARAISRIAAFRGMTGTAATAAMATAMMESSIQVADSDAKFYQTVSLQNLSNKQAQIIQKAGVLANFEIKNADNRMVAAVQNSQAFLAMDLKNLDNEQQSRVINTQNRVQSILEDAKAINTSRLFNAQSQNDMDMFYDNLGAQISQFNASQTNNMSQFNTGEVNSMAKFNSELENNRDQFYQSMQFNIDTANAKWRQDVTLHNSNQSFNAAALDVKNMVDISTEALNQLWDRSDAMLDYIWKSSESAKDRSAQLTIANISAATQKQIAQMQSDSADAAGIGSIFGTIAGNIAGSDAFTNWLF